MEENLGEGSQPKRHLSFFLYSRPAGQGASGLQEEEEGGEQGCGCVARGGIHITIRHKLANHFLWAFRRLSVGPLQGSSGRTYTSHWSISQCAATIGYCAATIGY